MEAKKQQVEKMGVYFEKSGYAPMAGRVFAFLLLAEPPYKDFYEIQEFLHASKSSISNALKTLSASGIVDYITFSGNRKRYFRVNMTNWMNIIKDREQKGTEINTLLNEVLATRTESKHLDFNEELKTVIEFQTYLTEEMKLAIERWEENRD